MFAISLPAIVNVTEFIDSAIYSMGAIVSVSLCGFVSFLIVKKAFFLVSRSFGDDEPESFGTYTVGNNSYFFDSSFDANLSRKELLFRYHQSEAYDLGELTDDDINYFRSNEGN